MSLRVCAPPMALKKLRTIDFTYGYWIEIMSLWTGFEDIYGQQMRSINVKIDVNAISGDHSYVKTLMTGLSPMIALKELAIIYEMRDQALVRTLVDQLTPIGSNCVSLKRLAIHLDISDVNIMRDLWRVLNEKFANRLTRLAFKGSYPQDWELMDESF
jgi:hypothetical protein